MTQEGNPLVVATDDTDGKAQVVERSSGNYQLLDLSGCEYLILDVSDDFDENENETYPMADVTDESENDINDTAPMVIDGNIQRGSGYTNNKTIIATNRVL